MHLTINSLPSKISYPIVYFRSRLRCAGSKTQSDTARELTRRFVSFVHIFLSLFDPFNPPTFWVNSIFLQRSAINRQLKQNGRRHSNPRDRQALPSRAVSSLDDNARMLTDRLDCFPSYRRLGWLLCDRSMNL